MSNRAQALVDAVITTSRLTQFCVNDSIPVDDTNIIFALFGKPGAARADRFL